MRFRKLVTGRGLLCLSLTILATGATSVAPAENGDVQRVSDLLAGKSPTDLARFQGELWACTGLDGKVYHLNTTLTQISATIDNPHGIGVIPNLTRTFGIALTDADRFALLASRRIDSTTSVWEIREVTPGGVEEPSGFFPYSPPNSDTANLRGLTFDDSTGDYWTLDVSNDVLLRFDSTGTRQTIDLPGQNPGNSTIQGEGVAYFESNLYVAYGDLFASSANQLLQVTSAGTETGVHVPLLDVPGQVAFGCELVRSGSLVRAAVLTEGGDVVEVEHTIPSTPPPSQLSCRLTTSNHVTLSWNNNGPGADGEYVGSSLNVLRNGTPVSTVVGGATTFTDRSPLEGESSYAIEATGTLNSPPSFPCDATVGPGGLIDFAIFPGRSPFDIGRDASSGDVFVSDDLTSEIYHYDENLDILGQIPTNQLTNPGAIAYVPSIDIPTLDPPFFVTIENVLAVGRTSSNLVALIDLTGSVLTTFPLQSAEISIGGLSYNPATEEFICVDRVSKDIFVFDSSGRFEESCFPRGPVTQLGPIELGISFDEAGGVYLAAFEDGLVRELISEPDLSGGCIATQNKFTLQSLGDGYDTEEDFTGGIQIDENTLLIAGRGSNAIFRVLVEPFTSPFQRGDATRDSVIDITDAVRIANALFVLGAPALSCQDAGDTNDDGVLDVSDPLYLLWHLFLGGPPPPPPFTSEGIDPTFRDNLGCEA